jgi:indole-3-glycerol phosphate synthase/phosphoribosylanthranilate isomerase
VSASRSTAPGILERIVARRRERIRAEGHGLASAVPEQRRVPVVPFAVPREPRAAVLVCEIKRRSPSAGAIFPDLDPVEQAGIYLRAGVEHLSILTEEDHFGGCLQDLVAAKRRFPQAAVLRKDFLLDEKDLEVSYRCGADAVLLIAALHDAETLGRLCRRAEELSLTPLVEIHDRADLEKARTARPALTGINSRDLSTFRVDRLAPLVLRGAVDWPTRLVYESGVQEAEHGRVAVAAGFDALLVGEAVVRRPALIPQLLGVTRQAGRRGSDAPGKPVVDGTARPAATAGSREDFWSRVADRLAGRLEMRLNGLPAGGRPLVKVCGLTRAADAERAAMLGADLLGFVFAASPRRADPSVLREVRHLPALKVGVAVSEEGTRLQPLLDEGLLDAVQLHGDEAPEQCAELAFPYYKALRIRGPADAPLAARYRCPRVLADAWSADARGGTGRRLEDASITALAERQPLWLAGGIGADNVGLLVRRYAPELIDASSRLEREPGRKEPALLERFFAELRTAVDSAAGGTA